MLAKRKAQICPKKEMHCTHVYYRSTLLCMHTHCSQSTERLNCSVSVMKQRRKGAQGALKQTHTVYWQQADKKGICHGICQSTARTQEQIHAKAEHV